MKLHLFLWHRGRRVSHCPTSSGARLLENDVWPTEFYPDVNEVSMRINGFVLGYSMMDLGEQLTVS